MYHLNKMARRTRSIPEVSSLLSLLALEMFVTSCAPRVLTSDMTAPRPSHYEAVVKMRVAAQHLLYGHPDFPGLLPLDIVMRNTADKAICFPLDLAPFPKGNVNEVFQVWETKTGVEVPRVVKGFVTESSDMHNNVRIIPPGEGTRFIARLSNGFDLVPGKEYRVLYDVEGYFCDAFDRGYPHTEAAYIEQEKSKLSFFDRTPSTVVKFKAELVFEVE